jgi:hypothetical protein
MLQNSVSAENFSDKFPASNFRQISATETKLFKFVSTITDSILKI